MNACIDAVLSYHMNPDACGVAKFNHLLAERLGVPCMSLRAFWLEKIAEHPLVSVKLSELPAHVSSVGIPYVNYDLLLHDRPRHQNRIVDNARRVFYADALGCPSMLMGNPDRGSYRVLTFGMAHKLVLPRFEELKEQLDRAHPDYTVSLSTAVHEGNPWDASLQESADAMRAIFGDKLRVLGFLSDDALARELQECDAVAMFYTPALRANNTSYWAAVAAGKTIYTNRDACSPQVGDPAPTWEQLIEVIRAA